MGIGVVSGSEGIWDKVRACLIFGDGEEGVGWKLFQGYPCFRTWIPLGLVYFMGLVMFQGLETTGLRKRRDWSKLGVVWLPFGLLYFMGLWCVSGSGGIWFEEEDCLF